MPHLCPYCTNIPYLCSCSEQILHQATVTKATGLLLVHSRVNSLINRWGCGGSRCSFREVLKGLRGLFYFFKACLDVEHRALFQMFGVQEQFRGPSDIDDVYQRQCWAVCWGCFVICLPFTPPSTPCLMKPRSRMLGLPLTPLSTFPCSMVVDRAKDLPFQVLWWRVHRDTAVGYHVK